MARCFAEAATDREAFAAMRTGTLRTILPVLGDPRSTPPGCDPAVLRRGQLFAHRELQRRRVPS